MENRSALLITAACTGLALVTACSVSASPVRGGTWAAARAVAIVQGPATYLNTKSITQSIWCGSRADCTVLYAGARSKVWVTSEVNGTWHAPELVAGLTGTYVSLALSCTGTGDCVAAGVSAGTGHQVAQVVTSVHGVWGAGRNVPGLASASGGGFSDVTGVSCDPAGWCVVAGEYGRSGSSLYGNAGHPLTPYLATVHDGTWTRAGQVPGLGALSAPGRTSRVSTVSCGTDGWCAAAGSYRDRSTGDATPFVVTGSDGIWGKAQPIGYPASGNAAISAISCITSGNCAAVGAQTTGGSSQPFVVTERNGAWERPHGLPGVSPGRVFTDAVITDLACSVPGGCVLAGYRAAANGDVCGGEYDLCYQGIYSATVPFVADQSNGVWHAAHAIAGLATLNRGGIAVITSISCGSPGNCAAGGFTTGLTQTPSVRGFIVTRSGGAWGQPVRVPGLAALHSVGSEVDFTFCGPDSGPSPGCVAIGGYGTGALPTAQWQRHLFATQR